MEKDFKKGILFIYIYIIYIYITLLNLTQHCKSAIFQFFKKGKWELLKILTEVQYVSQKFSYH